MTGTLHWISCPYCGEVSNLQRKGVLGKVVPAAQQDHITILQTRIIECLTCGHKFRTLAPTIFEAMGHDTVKDVPY